MSPKSNHSFWLSQISIVQVSLKSILWFINKSADESYVTVQILKEVCEFPRTIYNIYDIIKVCVWWGGGGWNIKGAGVMHTINISTV